MRQRRILAGEKTLADDLRALGWLYTWAQTELRVDFDSQFAGIRRFSPSELQRLIRFLRQQTGKDGAPRSVAGTAQMVARIEPFLAWLADVEERGGRGPIGPAELASYRDRLRHNFAAISRLQGPSGRIPPLSPDEEVRFFSLIDPVSKAGKIQFPVRFHERNPWKESVRLRNWIAVRLARELGLRRGAIGKLRIDDHKVDRSGPFIEVRRRAIDPADPRSASNRPRVKTIEYPLPISAVLSRALGQYGMTLLEHGGRRGARSPYLLVTSGGRPISGSSLDAVWKAARRRLPGVRLSWHVLRHTWAEETAEQLMKRENSEETALAVLRKLGGWTDESSAPLRYIRNVLKRRGDDYLRAKYAHFDGVQT
jgi:integrase